MSDPDNRRELGLLLRMEAERDIRLALEPHFPDGAPGDLVATLGAVANRLVQQILEPGQ